MKKIAALLLLVSAVQACSGASPTKSEAERAITSEFNDCPNLVVENFKLINGMKMDEATHQVEVQFDLRVIPLPERRLREIDAINETRAAEQQAILDSYDELERQYNELDKELDKLEASMSKELRDSGLVPENPGFFERRSELAKKNGYNHIKDEMKALRKQIYPGTSAPQPKTSHVDLGTEWGSSACMMKTGVKWVGNTPALDNAIRHGEVNAFHLTFLMVKTDNGWMKAR